MAFSYGLCLSKASILDLLYPTEAVILPSTWHSLCLSVGAMQILTVAFLLPAGSCDDIYLPVAPLWAAL